MRFDPCFHLRKFAKRRNSVWSAARGLKSKSYCWKNADLVEANMGVILVAVLPWEARYSGLPWPRTQTPWLNVREPGTRRPAHSRNRLSQFLRRRNTEDPSRAEDVYAGNVYHTKGAHTIGHMRFIGSLLRIWETGIVRHDSGASGSCIIPFRRDAAFGWVQGAFIEIPGKMASIILTPCIIKRCALCFVGFLFDLC